jgi:hypothetical protein
MNLFNRFFTKKKEVETVVEDNFSEEIQFSEEEKPIENTQTEEEKPAEKIESEENKFDADKIDWLINDSILTFMPRELYMHYWDENAVKDNQDPAWQNQGIYFWKENEPFEKKSLPPHFQDLEKKLFVFDTVPDYISLVSTLAMPWFGMPGHGEKFVLRYDDNPITLEEALKLGAIKYVDIITLNFENLSVLNDRDNYQFLINPSEVKFENQIFYLNGKEISLAELYQKGQLRIINN